ncbi:RNA-directed DNA polymerase, eukaryota [Tanacetum coccineum]
MPHVDTKRVVHKETIGFLVCNEDQELTQARARGWYLATRCTVHVCNSRDMFVDYEPVTGHEVILDNNSHVDVWRREDTGRSSDLLARLMDDLDQITRLEDEDTFCGNIGSTGLYTVGATRNHIDDLMLPTMDIQTRWYKIILRKVSIFFWRLRLDRLSHCLNLSRRGIDITSIMCPVCLNGLDSNEHLFFYCKVASNIWRLVRIWCDMSISILNFHSDWLDWIENLRISNTLKERMIVYRISVTLFSQNLIKCGRWLAVFVCISMRGKPKKLLNTDKPKLLENPNSILNFKEHHVTSPRAIEQPVKFESSGEVTPMSLHCYLPLEDLSHEWSNITSTRKSLGKEIILDFEQSVVRLGSNERDLERDLLKPRHVRDDHYGCPFQQSGSVETQGQRSGAGDEAHIVNANVNANLIVSGQDVASLCAYDVLESSGYARLGIDQYAFL